MNTHLVRASKGHPYRLQVERLQCPELDEVDVRAARHDGVDGVLSTGVRHKHETRCYTQNGRQTRQGVTHNGRATATTTTRHFHPSIPGGILRALRNAYEMPVYGTGGTLARRNASIGVLSVIFMLPKAIGS